MVPKPRNRSRRPAVWRRRDVRGKPMPSMSVPRREVLMLCTDPLLDFAGLKVRGDQLSKLTTIPWRMGDALTALKH